MNQERKRRTRYQKTNDSWLLPIIHQIAGGKPNFGNRRVTALLDRELTNQGKMAVNHKQIYRAMKEKQPLIQKHSDKPTRTQDGEIIKLKNNLRQCSDGFEIHCWNGEKIHVALSLDYCDREVMSYNAATAGAGAITRETNRDLMTETWRIDSDQWGSCPTLLSDFPITVRLT